MTLAAFDEKLIAFARRSAEPAARTAIAVVFFWFGFLKVLGLSPAGPLVEDLYYGTIGFLMPFGTFYLLFAWFEVAIGILFLIPRATRLVIALLAIHMFTTFGPLVFLPAVTWQMPFVPTLEGQYIIKNLVIIAAAIGIAAEMEPMRKKTP
jgi:uncharacterized membrane protein YphA (DoxX/SURF4 family)